MSAGRPSKKPRTESSSSSSMSESKSVTYPVINRVASGANVRGMPAYQAMYVFFPFFIFFFFFFFIFFFFYFFIFWRTFFFHTAHQTVLIHSTGCISVTPRSSCFLIIFLTTTTTPMSSSCFLLSVSFLFFPFLSFPFLSGTIAPSTTTLLFGRRRHASV